MRVEYNSNNSGGDWWLTDEDWKALEEAGWTVNWESERTDRYSTGDRFLGALATSASIEADSLRGAIEHWEFVTGQNARTLGCSCCGAPHSFTLYDDEDEWVDSYHPTAPAYGEPY